VPKNDFVQLPPNLIVKIVTMQLFLEKLFFFSVNIFELLPIVACYENIDAINRCICWWHFL